MEIVACRYKKDIFSTYLQLQYLIAVIKQNKKPYNKIKRTQNYT